VTTARYCAAPAAGCFHLSASPRTRGLSPLRGAADPCFRPSPAWAGGRHPKRPGGGGSSGRPVWRREGGGQ
jgi:hypothetical protein